MSHSRISAPAATFLVMALAACTTASTAMQSSGAEATLEDPDGNRVGEARLSQTPNGVHLDVRVEDMPPGTHGFHIHETGRCSPDFEAAGDHLSRNGGHGMFDDDGMHPGDLPNLHVPGTGELRVEVFNDRVALDPEGSPGDLPAIDDEDGAALVVHEGEDDYSSDPAGESGDRIACGVIR